MGFRSVVPLIVLGKKAVILRLKERKSPGTQRGEATQLVGARFIQVWPGQVSSIVKGRYGSTRLQRLDRRILSYVWFAGAA